MSDITRDYSFGGWLRKFRVDAGITLRDASKKLGLDCGNYSKLERSELDPPKSYKKIETMLSLYGQPDAIDFMVSLSFQHHLSKLKKDFEP